MGGERCLLGEEETGFGRNAGGGGRIKEQLHLIWAASGIKY